MKKLILLFVFATTFLAVGVANASMPTEGPDLNWFRVQVMFNTAELPQGVTIEDSNLPPFTSATNVLSNRPVLKNSSTTPIYFFLKKEKYVGLLSSVIFPKFKIPDNFIPIYKVVSNKTYCQIDFEHEDKPIENNSFEGCFYYSRSITPTNIPTDPFIETRVLLHLIDINPLQNVYGGNRPIDVKIPRPDSFELPSYYGGKLVNLKGSFVYSLNNDYGNYPEGYTPVSKKSENQKSFSKLSVANIYIIISSVVLGIFAYFLFFKKIKPLK